MPGRPRSWDSAKEGPLGLVVLVLVLVLVHDRISVSRQSCVRESCVPRCWDVRIGSDDELYVLPGIARSWHYGVSVVAAPCSMTRDMRRLNISVVRLGRLETLSLASHHMVCMIHRGPLSGNKLQAVKTTYLDPANI